MYWFRELIKKEICDIFKITNFGPPSYPPSDSRAWCLTAMLISSFDLCFRFFSKYSVRDNFHKIFLSAFQQTRIIRTTGTREQWVLLQWNTTSFRRHCMLLPQVITQQWGTRAPLLLQVTRVPQQDILQVLQVLVRFTHPCQRREEGLLLLKPWSPSLPLSSLWLRFSMCRALFLVTVQWLWSALTARTTSPPGPPLSPVLWHGS